ncbi:hypothetical protein DFJ73DRAFT_765222 [Zopfochytrium polystomum]|nr:hypothetical protein DFJ73DRAFT_765222 [Zopfochytrium polystomum]
MHASVVENSLTVVAPHVAGCARAQPADASVNGNHARESFAGLAAAAGRHDLVQLQRDGRVHRELGHYERGVVRNDARRGVEDRGNGTSSSQLARLEAETTSRRREREEVFSGEEVDDVLRAEGLAMTTNGQGGDEGAKWTKRKDRRKNDLCRHWPSPQPTLHPTRSPSPSRRRLCRGGGRRFPGAHAAANFRRTTP